MQQEPYSSEVLEVREKIIESRRRLHRIPEPGFKELETAALIAEELERLGLEVRDRVGETGVVGVLQGSRDGPTLMLRADMDGLPLTEQTGLDFASQHEGMMHACGHDGHMAMVLGAAQVLSRRSEALCGRIVFLFQPAEEGPGGAEAMIREGVLEDYGVSAVFGCHLWPDLPEGSVGVREGAIMAALGRFDITIKGKGGHGAMPHHCVDAVDVGVQVVNGLQRLVSRGIDPLQPAVVTVGSFQAGSAFNVIAGEARIKGTTRTFEQGMQSAWSGLLHRVVGGICSSAGADYELSFTPGYPPTVNDVGMAECVRRIARGLLGEDRVLRPEPSMGAEDMSLFLEKVPGCYFFLGVGREGGHHLHHPGFDFNEQVLLTGVELYRRLALDRLGPE
jgi:amidohydrolase